MEARQGRDAAGGSMRYAHDSATGHVSWPGTHGLQGSMYKLMRQSSGNRFDSGCCGLADPAQPVRRPLRGAKLRAAGIARRAFPWRQAQRAAPQARRREGLKPNGRDGEVAPDAVGGVGTGHVTLTGVVVLPDAGLYRAYLYLPYGGAAVLCHEVEDVVVECGNRPWRG